MDAHKTYFVDGLFKENVQFIIPCYQREYKWTTKKIETLWNDISVLMSNARNLDEHLMGAIILFDNNEQSDGQIKKYWVIDGQQRLTTVYIMLKALYDLAVEKGRGRIVDELNDVLFNKNFGSIEDQFKIRSKNEDEPALEGIMGKDPSKTSSRTLIHKAYDWFRTNIKKYVANEGTYDDILTAIKKLILIKEVFVETDHEDPQVIFEHVNYDREQLTLFDKVRNILLTGEKYKNAEIDYRTYWKPLEALFVKTFLDKKEIEAQENEYMRTFCDFIEINETDDDRIYEEFRKRLDKEIIEAQKRKEDLTNKSIGNNFKNSDDPTRIELPDGEVDESESPSDFVRVKYLKQLLYYSYFYVLFVNNKEDKKKLGFGSGIYDYGKAKGDQHEYHYLWDVRVLLYWFRFLNITGAYTLFFKLFELEDHGQISQETIKKILLLILDFAVRYFIVNGHFVQKNYLSYGALWNRILKDNDNRQIEDKELNDINCYELFANWFERPKDNWYTIYQDGDIIESLTNYSNWITNTNVIMFIFLIIYYKQIIFDEKDNLLTFDLFVMSIFPQLNLEDFKDTSWAKELGEHQIEYLLNRRVGAIGNIAIANVDAPGAKLDGIEVDHKNGVTNFKIDGGEGDFAAKKELLRKTKFYELYSIILNATTWGKQGIEKQSEFIAKELVKYLRHYEGEE